MVPIALTGTAQVADAGSVLGLSGAIDLLGLAGDVLRLAINLLRGPKPP